jgi:hypothetical protein
MYLVSIDPSLFQVYLCDTSSHRHKTNRQILSLDNCSFSSEYDIAENISLNGTSDEFAC